MPFPFLPRMAPARLALRLLLLALCVLAATPVWRVLVVQPGRETSRVVAEWDQQRFEDVRRFLPPGEQVGYLTDNPKGEYDVGGEVGGYYVAQFVLAPAILVPDSGQALVLVNGWSHRPHFPEEIRRLKLIHDCGNGVRLYAREH